MRAVPLLALGLLFAACAEAPDRPRVLPDPGVPAQYMERTGFDAGTLEGSIDRYWAHADPAAGRVEATNDDTLIMVRGHTDGVVMTGLWFWNTDLHELRAGDRFVLDRREVDEEFEYEDHMSGVSSFSCGGPADDDFQAETSHEVTVIEVTDVVGDELDLHYEATFAGNLGRSEGVVRIDLSEVVRP